MSSATSEPGDGDATEQPRLRLDTVIQVSQVAAVQHPLAGPKGTLRGKGACIEATAPWLQGHFAHAHVVSMSLRAHTRGCGLGRLAGAWGAKSAA